MIHPFNLTCMSLNWDESETHCCLGKLAFVKIDRMVHNAKQRPLTILSSLAIQKVVILALQTGNLAVQLSPVSQLKFEKRSALPA